MLYFPYGVEMSIEYLFVQFICPAVTGFLLVHTNAQLMGSDPDRLHEQTYVSSSCPKSGAHMAAIRPKPMGHDTIYPMISYDIK